MTMIASSAITPTTYMDSMGDYSALTCRVRPSTAAMTASLPASIATRAGIARGPVRAAVFDAAALARLEARGDHDAVADGQALVDMAAAVSHHFIEPPPEAEHRDDRQRGEDQPLRPARQVDADEAEQAHDRRRQSDENEVELGVDDEHLDTEQADAQNQPGPPRHPIPQGADRAVSAVRRKA